MKTDIFAAAAAFVAGVVIAFLSYLFSKFILRKYADKYAVAQILRQVVHIGYLFVLFLAAPYTPWDRMWLVTGGVLGVTLPMFWFTFRLVKLNNSMNEKEDSADG